MRVAKTHGIAIAGGLLLGDSLVVLTIGGGVNAGTLLPGLAGSALIAAAVLAHHYNINQAPARSRRMLTVLAVTLLLGLIPLLAIEGLIAASAFPGRAAPSRWLLVLGAGLRGGTPSLTLQQRLNTALEHLQENPGVQAILSGGQGRGETMSEAEAMSRFLLGHGIATNRLIKEERSTSTFENLRFCKDILDAKGLDSGETVDVISSDFHLFRVKFLAKRAGLSVHTISAPSPWYLLPNTCMREFFAVIKSFLLDR